MNLGHVRPILVTTTMMLKYVPYFFSIGAPSRIEDPYFDPVNYYPRNEVRKSGF